MATNDTGWLTLYRDNLLTGRWVISSHDLAKRFLADDKMIEGLNSGQRLDMTLSYFVMDRLQSAIDIRESAEQLRAWNLAEDLILAELH